jgi:hypothetical protein
MWARVKNVGTIYLGTDRLFDPPPSVKQQQNKSRYDAITRKTRSLAHDIQQLS